MAKANRKLAVQFVASVFGFNAKVAAGNGRVGAVVLKATEDRTITKAMRKQAKAFARENGISLGDRPDQLLVMYGDGRMAMVRQAKRQNLTVTLLD